MGHRDLLVTHTILLASAECSYFYPREASAAPAASFFVGDSYKGERRWRKRMSAVMHTNATNSSTDIPAARINARNVPGASSRCVALISHCVSGLDQNDVA